MPSQLELVAQAFMESPELIATFRDLELSATDQALVLMEVGHALQRRFERTGLLDDIHRAIDTKAQATALLPSDHRLYHQFLNRLGNAFVVRYESMGSSEDLDQAIEWEEKGLDACPANNSYRFACLNDLGIAMRLKFEQTGILDDLNRAIGLAKNAGSMATTGDAHRAAALSNLSMALILRFERTQSEIDLNDATESAQNAVAAVPDGHPYQPICLFSLGEVLFRSSKENEVLDAAISAMGQAIFKMEQRKARSMFLFGQALLMRYENTKSPEDLKLIIETLQASLDSISDKNPNRGNILYLLYRAFDFRSELTKSVDDFDRVVEIGKEALKFLPGDGPRAVALGLHLSLGITFSKQSKRSGNLSDLDRTINVRLSTLRSLCENDPLTASIHARLVKESFARYEQTGSEEHLENALRSFASLMDGKDPDQCSTRASTLHYLAAVLAKKCARTGSIDEWDEVIDVARESVNITPVEDRERSGRVLSLIRFLTIRMMHKSRIEDAEEANRILETILSSTEESDPIFSRALKHYAYLLDVRLTASGSLRTWINRFK